MTETSKISTETLVGMFEYADLEVGAVRLSEKLTDYRETRDLAHSVSIPGLGETAPATAFNASWQ